MDKILTHCPKCEGELIPLYTFSNVAVTIYKNYCTTCKVPYEHRLLMNGKLEVKAV